MTGSVSCGEALGVEMPRDLGSLFELGQQRRVLLEGGSAGAINDVVGILAAGVLGQRHHHGLGDDQPAGQVEVAAHALRHRRSGPPA